MPETPLLDSACTLERATFAADVRGSKTVSAWVVVFLNIPCRFTNTQPGETVEKRAAEFNEIPSRMYCDTQQTPQSGTGLPATVTIDKVMRDATYRVKWVDQRGLTRYFAVLGVADMGRRNRLARIDCIERQEGFQGWV